MPEAIVHSTRLVCLTAVAIFVMQAAEQIAALAFYLDWQKPPKVEPPRFHAPDPELRQEKLYPVVVKFRR